MAVVVVGIDVVVDASEVVVVVVGAGVVVVDCLSLNKLITSIRLFESGNPKQSSPFCKLDTIKAPSATPHSCKGAGMFAGFALTFMGIELEIIVA